MILKLQVVNDPGRRSEPAVFREAGGTIGRSTSCQCVLPDQSVSKFHARIIYRNGSFLIEDTSQNGVFLNSPTNRLPKGEPYELQSGDVILIDPYELSVTLEEGFESRPESIIPPDPFATGELDPNVLIPDVGRKKSAGRRLDDLPSPAAQNQPYRPPDPIIPDPILPDPTPRSGHQLIPDDWELTGFGDKRAPAPPPPPRPAPPPPAPPPPPRPAPPAIDHDPTPASSPRPSGLDSARPTGELAEVLKGAGLPPNLVTPELARDFGRIIRIIITGLMDVLHARQEIKNEFGMQVTQFRPSRNNPLKFSADVEHALENLLVSRTKAFLEPVAAFEDAFDDVRHHQVAMLAGMRAGFEAMLKTFSPQALQEEFDKRSKGSLLSGPAKLRYWDQYKAKFDDMVADTERTFKDLFGEEFARAYDDQLERLKAERRSGRAKP